VVLEWLRGVESPMEIRTWVGWPTGPKRGKSDFTLLQRQGGGGFVHGHPGRPFEKIQETDRDPCRGFIAWGFS